MVIVQAHISDFLKGLQAVNRDHRCVRVRVNVPLCHRSVILMFTIHPLCSGSFFQALKLKSVPHSQVRKAMDGAQPASCSNGAWLTAYHDRKKGEARAKAEQERAQLKALNLAASHVAGAREENYLIVWIGAKNGKSCTAGPGAYGTRYSAPGVLKELLRRVELRVKGRGPGEGTRVRGRGCTDLA